MTESLAVFRELLSFANSEQEVSGRIARPAIAASMHSNGMPSGGRR